MGSRCRLMTCEHRVCQNLLCHLSPFCSFLADIQSAQDAMLLVNGYILQGKPLVIEFGKSKGQLTEPDAAAPCPSAGETPPAK